MPSGIRRRQRRDAALQPLDLTSGETAGLRRAQLELFDEFARVCAANDLTFFAMYGTALGAVRHHGFIPWDDDLDVGMLRSDFDRLTQIAEDEFTEPYFFQTARSDPHYGCMFAKLRMTGTRCVDRVSSGSRQHGGISIDVFPLDAKASRAWSTFVQRLARFVGFRLLYVKAGYLVGRGTSARARLVQIVARSTVRVISRRLIIAMTDRLTRLGSAESSGKYVSLFGGYAYDREIVDVPWILPLVDVAFEDGTIPTFADVDAYLTHLYGDYRKLPPLNQRVGPHDLIELEFGDTADDANT